MGEQRKIRRRRKILRIFKFWYCRILLLKRISGVIHFENPRKIPPAARSLPSLSLSLSLSENIIIYKEMSTRSFLNSDQNFDTEASVTLQSQDSRRTALCWWYLVLPEYKFVNSLRLRCRCMSRDRSWMQTLDTNCDVGFGTVKYNQVEVLEPWILLKYQKSKLHNHILSGENVDLKILFYHGEFVFSKLKNHENSWKFN